jgi:hypothetical protein
MARQPFFRKQNPGGGDVTAALRALDPDELRAFVAEAIEQLDGNIRRPIEDALLRRAATRGGYRPATPSPEIVDEVAEFAKAAQCEAMRAAASKRAGGVTGQKRRRHYDHAATLVGCCVEADRAGSAAWLEGLRARTSRFPAFQEALRAALGGGRLHVEMRSFVHGE